MCGGGRKRNGVRMKEFVYGEKVCLSGVSSVCGRDDFNFF